MSHAKKSPSHQRGRALRFETCEPRVMLTARSNAAELVAPFLTSSLGISESIFTQFDLLPASLSAAHEQTGMDQVRARYGLNGSGQTVAIIDSGVAYDHPALGGGFGTNYRVVGGWDFTEGQKYVGEWNPYDDGPYGSHGTHVAGIVGSEDPNNFGVAPTVDLVALRVFDDSGTGWFSWIEDALKWVYQHRNDFRNPITTVNLSLGVGWNSDQPPNWAMLEDEFLMLEQVGMFISVAAGNDFQYFGEPGLDYPAASPYVVSAMSTNASGDLSYFSQRLGRAIAAPGQGIRSTVPDYVGNQNGQTDDFATYSGTSMAAPYLAGAAVIVRQALEMTGRVNIDQDMIYQVIRSTADRIYDAATNAYYSRLNLARAVDSVMGEDLEGYSRSTGSHVGSFGLRKNSLGSIDYDGDRDFFSFKALRSGKVTISIDGDEGTRFQLRRFFADGSSRYVNGNSITMTVKAGRTYEISVRGREGMGDYRSEFRLTPYFEDLGRVGRKTIRHQRLSGEKWYCFSARLDGDVLAKSWIDRGTKDIRLELYDSDFRRLETGSGRYKDVVRAGAARDEIFFVRLAGKNSDVNLRLRTIVETTPADPLDPQVAFTTQPQATDPQRSVFLFHPTYADSTGSPSDGAANSTSKSPISVFKSQISDFKSEGATDRAEMTHFADRPEDYSYSQSARFFESLAKSLGRSKTSGSEVGETYTDLSELQAFDGECFSAPWCDEVIARLAA